MPGVVFLICIPTANFEKDLANGIFIGNNFNNNELPPEYTDNNKNLNINLQDNNNITSGIGNNGGNGSGNVNNVGNAVLRLEVELRDKNSRPYRFQSSPLTKLQPNKCIQNTTDEILNNCRIPLESVLEELLKKLQIENVTWSCDKKSQYYQVIFPIQSGDPCETTLHCLTELGIGSKYNSSISVMPCSVSYDGARDTSNEEVYRDAEEFSKWNNFVESIKSKLTVKQVVDGVRAGGQLSFDYLLLIVTADSLAALGLVENNAPNIVAAMLVSPLMGPVMSITFGAIISDRELMKVGFISLGLGIFISILFGFIFGLILGTTEMPWGFGDWPTEEMKGRGNARSLWMGVLWALTSGTGVAVALLQGSAGPLIGVAISASLLPPVVNCGLFWALACIWLLYDGTKIPHIKGEPYKGNSTYIPLYTNYLPTEFLINGIVSALLTVVNVICIFITAIIVLKIKEVAAPYTSSPDLRRFWETDIRTVRKTNRSTIRRNNGKMSQNQELYNPVESKNLENALEQALKEAVDDETLRKVKRMSYSSNAADELKHRIPILAAAVNNNNNNNNSGNIQQGTSSSSSSATTLYRNNSMINNKLKTDLAALDKLVTSLLEQHTTSASSSSSTRNSTTIFDRLKSNSLRHRRHTNTTTNFDGIITGIPQDQQQLQQQSLTTTMPTILETTTNNNSNGQYKRVSWSNDKNINPIRRVVNSIVNSTLPQRYSNQINNNNCDEENDENINLTENILN